MEKGYYIITLTYQKNGTSKKPGKDSSNDCMASIDIPLVSLCMPVYNSADYIIETINCLIKQSYKNIELIVVNDGSTDNSLEILNSFAYNDKIKIIDKPNTGAADTRNVAFQASSGNYVIFFDADDLVPENFIESQFSKINNEKDVVVVAKWGRFYHGDLSTYKTAPENVNQDMTFTQWINAYWRYNKHTTPPGRVLLSREIVNKAGLWNTKLTLNDDFDFFVRAFSKAKVIRFNSDTTFYYRSGNPSLSGLKSEKAAQSSLTSILSGIVIARENTGMGEDIKRSCANMLQAFVYEFYPHYPSLVYQAEEEISNLGGSDFKIQGGKMLKFLSFLVGWKTAKKIQNKFNAFRK